MSKKITVILICVLMVSLFAAQTALAAPKILQLGFTTAPNQNDPYNVFATEFAKLIDEKARGEIKIDVFHSGQLGPEREMADGMQLGTLDMGVITNAYVSHVVPACGLFDLPFIFANNKIAADILDGPVGTAVLAEIPSHGFIGLAWGEGGFRHLVTANAPVRTPEDILGLKIRCMETKSYLEAYAALGVNAVPMAWSEVITALQQKTIDGLDIPISVIYSNGFAEVARYLCMSGHFYSPLVLCISNQAWSALNKEQQTIVRECAVEAGRRTRANNARVEGQLIAEMKAKGMNIIDDVDIPAFQAKLSAFYEQQKKSIGGTFVDDLLNALGK